MAGLLVILDILAETLQALDNIPTPPGTNNPHASLEFFEVELTSIYERVSTVQNQPSAWTKLSSGYQVKAGKESRIA